MEPVQVLLVCSGGGHLSQLWSLRPAWEPWSRAWVVENPDRLSVLSMLGDERVAFAHSPAERSVRNLLRNSLLAWRVLRATRPSVVLTTGAAVAVPFAWFGRLFGAKVVWIESMARVTTPSLSCRMAAPAASRLYVQWPELLAALPRAKYVETVFSRG